MTHIYSPITALLYVCPSFCCSWMLSLLNILTFFFFFLYPTFHLPQRLRLSCLDDARRVQLVISRFVDSLFRIRLTSTLGENELDDGLFVSFDDVASKAASSR